MEFLSQIFGDHSLAFHGAGIFFALLGAIGYKWHDYRRHKAAGHTHDGHPEEFSFWHWIKDNWDEVLIGILASFVFLRFLDIFLEWLSPKIEAGFGIKLPITDDQVFYYFIAGVLIQWFIDIKYRAKVKK